MISQTCKGFESCFMPLLPPPSQATQQQVRMLAMDNHYQQEEVPQEEQQQQQQQDSNRSSSSSSSCSSTPPRHPTPRASHPLSYIIPSYDASTTLAPSPIRLPLKSSRSDTSASSSASASRRSSLPNPPLLHSSPFSCSAIVPLTHTTTSTPRSSSQKVNSNNYESSSSKDVQSDPESDSLTSASLVRCSSCDTELTPFANGPWQCDSCTFVNLESHAVCMSCAQSKEKQRLRCQDDACEQNINRTVGNKEGEQEERDAQENRWCYRNCAHCFLSTFCPPADKYWSTAFGDRNSSDCHRSYTNSFTSSVWYDRHNHPCVSCTLCGSAVHIRSRAMKQIRGCMAEERKMKEEGSNHYQVATSNLNELNNLNAAVSQPQQNKLEEDKEQNEASMTTSRQEEKCNPSLSATSTVMFPPTEQQDAPPSFSLASSTSSDPSSTVPLSKTPPHRRVSFKSLTIRTHDLDQIPVASTSTPVARPSLPAYQERNSAEKKWNGQLECRNCQHRFNFLDV